MKKKIEILDAVVDGHEQGEVIEVEAKTAEMLERNGYAKILDKKEDKKKDDEDKK